MSFDGVLINFQFSKLEEVDLVESFAWWTVKHCNANTETAWNYTTVVNAFHFRNTGVHLAANHPLTRVHNMLQGMQRLTGQAIPRIKRIGVRPAHLSQGIKAAYTAPRVVPNVRAPRVYTMQDKIDANWSALSQSGLVGLARACELATNLPRGALDLRKTPSRNDVKFRFDAQGRPTGCMLYIVNSKAKGAESFRRLPVPLPMTGKYLSPGQAIYDLIEIIDKVPRDQYATTPLFRDPVSGNVLTVTQVRDELRRIMYLIGRDGSRYGAHNLMIGGATALAWLGALPENIKAHGRWKSDAYMRYIRERESQCLFYTGSICGADVDDFEADYLDFEADLDDDDMM